MLDISIQSEAMDALNEKHAGQDGLPYALILHSPATNAVAHISARKKSYTVNSITKKGTLRSGELTVFVENFVSPLRISAHKLLDALAIELTKQTDYRGKVIPFATVTIPLAQYMQLCGQNQNNKPQVDKARRNAEEDLNALLRISFEWRGHNPGEKKGVFKTNLLASFKLKNGTITATFTPTLTAYLQSAYLMHYNLNLFKLNGHNPNIWFIARKLNEHYSITQNQNTGTAGTLSVNSLLRAAPDIPSYEEVTESDRHYAKRIIKPLEESLDQLVNAGILREWTYWNARNKPLSDKQLTNMTYETFTKLYIHFEFMDALQDTRKVLEAKKAGPVKKRPRRRK